MSPHTRGRAAGRYHVGRLLWVSTLVVGFLLLVMAPAQAYIDPGSGSYAFQVGVGAFLGFVVSLKLFWRRIWSMATRRRATDR